MTSLTDDETTLALQVCAYARESPYGVAPELRKQLTRFEDFYITRPCPTWPRKKWETPWGRTAAGNQAIKDVERLFTRQNAFKAPNPPIRPPSRKPTDQSLLYTMLPAELVELIFKFMVVEDCPIWVFKPPPITRVSRLIRQHTLPVFLHYNNFELDADILYLPKAKIEKLMGGMRPYMTDIRRITFQFSEEFHHNSKYHSYVRFPVTLRHNRERGCWDVTTDEAALRRPFDTETTIMVDLMRQLVEGRSNQDLSPEYLIHLMHDLRLLYNIEKSEGHVVKAWRRMNNDRREPDVPKPPDMYTRDVFRDQMLRWREKKEAAKNLEASQQGENGVVS